MKKMILGSILGLMSAVAFAQGQAPVGEKGEPHKHTRAEVHAAKEACKGQIGKPEDKKAGHEAFKQCMETKGIKHFKHHKPHDGKPGMPHPEGKPMPHKDGVKPPMAPVGKDAPAKPLPPVNVNGQPIPPAPAMPASK